MFAGPFHNLILAVVFFTVVLVGVRRPRVDDDARPRARLRAARRRRDRRADGRLRGPDHRRRARAATPGDAAARCPRRARRRRPGCAPATRSSPSTASRSPSETDDGWTAGAGRRSGSSADTPVVFTIERDGDAAGPHGHADREHRLRRGGQRRRPTDVGFVGVSPAQAYVRQSVTAVPGFLGDDRRRGRCDKLVEIPQRVPQLFRRGLPRRGARPAGADRRRRRRPDLRRGVRLRPVHARPRRSATSSSCSPASTSCCSCSTCCRSTRWTAGTSPGRCTRRPASTVARRARPAGPGPVRHRPADAGGLRRRRAVPGAVGAAVRRRHRQPDHPGLSEAPRCRRDRRRSRLRGEHVGTGAQGILGVMAIPVSLGMPAAPPPVLAPRRKTRQLDVGGVGVGSDFPVSVQSMTTTKTADINATLQQIAELTAAGCQIVRVAVPDTDDAEALPAIAKKSQIPVIADIHFQPRYVFAAIDAGCAAVRVNPGNIKKFDDKVGEIARAAKDAGIPIRIGVNAGSLDKRLLAKYGKATPGGAGRVGAVGVLAVRGARLPRHQDLGQAQRPGRHGARLRAARRAVRLPAAPRRHRGRPGLPGHDQVRRRLRRPAVPGHRRHDPRLPLRPAGGGGQGRQPDPRVAQPAPARPGDRQLPLLRPRPGRRLHARRARSPPASRAWRCRCGSPSWAASSTARARPARPTSASPPATARARSSSRARSSRPCPSRRSSRP